MPARRVSPAAGWRLRNSLAFARSQTPPTAPVIPAKDFDPTRHAYVLGTSVVPGTTEVIREARLIDPTFEAIPAAALDAARIRGTLVHQMIEFDRANDFDHADCPEDLRGYFESYRRYVEGPAAALTPLATEWWFVCHERRFGGKIDAIDLDGDVLVVSDFKTGRPDQVSTALQLAAYEYGVRKYFIPAHLPGYQGSIRRQSVKLHGDGSPVTLDVYRDPRDLPLFFAALSLLHFRRNALHHPGAA